PQHHHLCSNHTPTTELYTLSLHDALPICITAPVLNPSSFARLRSTPPMRKHSPGGCISPWASPFSKGAPASAATSPSPVASTTTDRKSTRLNSSHVKISYAVFCLKKKKNH